MAGSIQSSAVEKLGGTVFDAIAAIILTTPFVSPLIIGLEFDPIWWGIVLVMVIEIGMITQPNRDECICDQCGRARYFPAHDLSGHRAVPDRGYYSADVGDCFPGDCTGASSIERRVKNVEQARVSAQPAFALESKHRRFV